MASINDKLRKYKSLFSTTLSTGIGTGTSDTITPATVTGLPTDTAITLTIDRVDSSGTATPSKLERIKGIISGGNLIDYVRGIDGTTEQAHSAGAVVEMVWNAADWNDNVDWGLVQHGQDGVHTSALITSLKAAASDINTGTSDTTIVTPKALADSAIKQSIDEDDMASNLDTKVPTQQSVKAYVDGRASATQTLTGKRIEPRIVTAASYTTDTGTSLSVATADVFQVTAQSGALKLNNPGGTPVAGQKLIIRIKDDGTARALTYDTQFRASTDLALPATTVLGKTLYMGFIFNATDTKWDLLAVLNNF